jgi:hypothetical protein
VDLTKPIDISAVNNTRIEYSNVLVGLNMMAVADLLANMTPRLGVLSSLVLGKTEHGTIAKKYTGTFVGDKKIGTIVPRTLVVYPCVAEIDDEPERLRRSYIADVAGGLWNQAHPFELWLLQYGIKLASEEMFYALFPAVRSEVAENVALTDSFDGFFAITDADITAGRVSAVKKNLYANGAITRANAGEYLLDMWRSRHKSLRNVNTNLWMSYDVADLYDDWYRDEHDNPPMVDQAGQIYLEGTNGRCKLIRTAAFPEASQRVYLTTRENMVYGTDKLEDMKAMMAFASGNPYHFTAAMKFIFGTQFVSVHEREFCVNDRSGTGSGSF